MLYIYFITAFAAFVSTAWLSYILARYSAPIVAVLISSLPGFFVGLSVGAIFMVVMNYLVIELFNNPHSFLLLLLMFFISMLGGIYGIFLQSRNIKSNLYTKNSLEYSAVYKKDGKHLLWFAVILNIFFVEIGLFVLWLYSELP